MVVFALTCFALILFLWISFGGPVPLQPQGYRITVSFNEAVQLATQADVRISGVNVGTVKSVDPKAGRTDAVLELDQRYAPLPSDAKATLRLKTLLGETFVELTPGTKSPDVPAVPENGRLASANVEDLVELDEVIRIFDPTTRESLITWLQQQAIALRGRGDDLNEALGTLPIFFSEGNNVLTVFERQHEETKELIRSSADVFEAIDSREGQLTELVTASNRLLSVTARRNEQLAQTWREFPAFLRAAKITVKRFTPFTQNTSAFVDRTTDIANEFSPTIKQSVDVANETRQLVDNLDPTLDRADTSLPYINEFLDLSKPLLSQADPFLRNLNPVLEFIGLYQAEIAAAFGNDASASQTRIAVNALGEKKRYGNVLKVFANASPTGLGYSANRYDKSRGNAYPATGWYNPLESGLKVFDAAHCAGIPVPALDPDTTKYDAAFPGTTGFRTLLVKYFYNGDDTAPLAAPACVDQGPVTFGGETTYYPHVRERTSP